MARVRATRTGYWENRRVREGQVFDFPDKLIKRAQNDEEATRFAVQVGDIIKPTWVEDARRRPAQKGPEAFNIPGMKPRTPNVISPKGNPPPPAGEEEEQQPEGGLDEAGTATDGSQGAPPAPGSRPQDEAPI